LPFLQNSSKLQLWQRLVVRDYPHAIVEEVQDWKEEWANLRKNKFNPERTHSWLKLSEDNTQGNYTEKRALGLIVFQSGSMRRLQLGGFLW